MKIMDDIINNINEKIYKNKAEICLVSPLLIRGRVAEDGISIPKLLRYSHSKANFDILVRDELTYDRNTDFYDFSLLMGQIFGVYNLYSYQYVKRDVRCDIVNSKVDSKYTNRIFDKYGDKIFEYVSSTYNISNDEYISLIVKMFKVIDDYSIYNNDIVKDIGKILLGNILYGIDYFGGNYDYLINCEDAIDYFDKCNSINKRNIK